MHVDGSLIRSNTGNLPLYKPLEYYVGGTHRPAIVLVKYRKSTLYIPGNLLCEFHVSIFRLSSEID